MRATEVISSGFCRGLVSDDENDQAATADAFDVLRYIAGKRLAAGRLTTGRALAVPAIQHPAKRGAIGQHFLNLGVWLWEAGMAASPDLRGYANW